MQRAISCWFSRAKRDGARRATILSWVKLGDLPALETEVSGWTELAGWRCVNFTNNPGKLRRALEEEETAAYHVLLASFIRSLLVPCKSPFVCAVQKLEILVDSQRELHNKVDRLLQEASGSSVAAARQADAQTGATEGAQVVARRADTQNGATEGAKVVARRADTQNGATEGAQVVAWRADTQNGATEGAQVAALRNYSANGAGEGAQGAGLPKYRQHGANHSSKAKPAATEARTRRNVRASAHCAADEGAVAVNDTPSSCDASPRATKERGKRGGKQVRQQQPSSRSWRTCRSQSGTMGRVQQSKDCEGTNCLQLRCNVRACCASDLHGMHVQIDSVNEAHFACFKSPKRLLLWR